MGADSFLVQTDHSLSISLSFSRSARHPLLPTHQIHHVTPLLDRRSEYPYEKQSRIHFHKTLLDKPANSWPPAPGCDLSFKNPYKLYGTMLFESVHSRDQLKGRLPKESLLESCLALANFSFRQKLELFKTVETAISHTPPDSPRYSILKDKEI